MTQPRVKITCLFLQCISQFTPCSLTTMWLAPMQWPGTPRGSMNIIIKVMSPNKGYYTVVYWSRILSLLALYPGSN